MTSYSLAQFLKGDFVEAIRFADRALSARSTWVPALRVKAASLALSQDYDAAKLIVERIKVIDPGGSNSVMQRMIQLQADHLSSYIAALRKAGMDA
jgi:hypothetical protein